MVLINGNNLKYGYRDKADSQDLSAKNNIIKFSQIFGQFIGRL